MNNPTYGRLWTYEIRNEDDYNLATGEFPDDAAAEKWFESFSLDGYAGKYSLYRLKSGTDFHGTLLAVTS